MRERVFLLEKRKTLSRALTQRKPFLKNKHCFSRPLGNAALGAGHSPAAPRRCVGGSKRRSQPEGAELIFARPAIWKKPEQLEKLFGLQYAPRGDGCHEGNHPLIKRYFYVTARERGFSFCFGFLPGFQIPQKLSLLPGKTILTGHRPQSHSIH